MSCHAVVFAQSIEVRCQVENVDLVGAAPTGDAPTTSDWSTILLPTKVSYIRGWREYAMMKYLQPNWWLISIFSETDWNFSWYVAIESMWYA